MDRITGGIFFKATINETVFPFYGLRSTEIVRGFVAPRVTGREVWKKKKKRKGTKIEAKLSPPARRFLPFFLSFFPPVRSKRRAEGKDKLIPPEEKLGFNFQFENNITSLWPGESFLKLPGGATFFIYQESTA